MLFTSKNLVFYDFTQKKNFAPENYVRGGAPHLPHQVFTALDKDWFQITSNNKGLRIPCLC